MKNGERTEAVLPKDPTFKIIADLRRGIQPTLTVQTKWHTNQIPLSPRMMNFGGPRWYFQDERGRRCEVLYLDKASKRWVSREFAGLTYASQARSKQERLWLLQDRIDRELIGTPSKGPARGKRREKLLERKERLSDQIDHIATGFVDNAEKESAKVDTTKAKARKRRNRSRNRMQKAKAEMEKRRTVSAEKVVALYGPLVSELKAKTRRYKADPLQSRDYRVDENGRVPSLDIGILASLGYVKPGKLLGDQIGWSTKKIRTAGRRLFFLIDSRSKKRPCVVTIVHDRGEKPRAKLFDIVTLYGRNFGRQEHYFEDPATGACSKVLRYWHGDFRLPPGSDGFDKLIQPGLSAEALAADLAKMKGFEIEPSKKMASRNLSENAKPRTAKQGTSRSETKRDVSPEVPSKSPQIKPDSVQIRTTAKPESSQFQETGAKHVDPAPALKPSPAPAGKLPLWNETAEQLEIVSAYRPRVEAMRAKMPRAAQQRKVELQDEISDAPASIRVRELVSFGYIPSYSFTSRIMDWPLEWTLASDRRLFLVIDTRVPENEYVVFFVQDGQAEPVMQFYWIAWVGYGHFPYFEDPASGEICDTVFFRNGRFGFGESPDLTRVPQKQRMGGASRRLRKKYMKGVLGRRR